MDGTHAQRGATVVLTFAEIHDTLGFEIEHSFLHYKQEAVAYGYQVSKISLKEKCVRFARVYA